MEYETFIHIDPDEFHGKELSLHDCTADKISFENHTLCFYLSDGFWVTPHHKANSSEKVVRTDASVVSFSIDDIDDIMVRVFTRKRWCFSRKTSVEIWHMEQLMDSVNSGKCMIEFITQYRTSTNKCGIAQFDPTRNLITENVSCIYPTPVLLITGISFAWIKNGNLTDSLSSIQTKWACCDCGTPNYFLVFLFFI